jgi:hypothetical protein
MSHFCPICEDEHEDKRIRIWRGMCKSEYHPKDQGVYYTCSLQTGHMFKHCYEPLGLEWETGA